MLTPIVLEGIVRDVNNGGNVDQYDLYNEVDECPILAALSGLYDKRVRVTIEELPPT